MEYRGVIWTNHALQRLSERGIKIDHALLTLNSPQESRYAVSKGAWVYYRTWENERIEVVAKQNENQEWVVLSVWSKRIFDKGYAKPESWWKYLWRQILGR
ncbi:MAG TPA: DUF4258 domain-containing protein [Clostridia bacterium]|nr:DUF4258 domain-containing protein [Clostridia bacterium]